ncbi:MAG: response regulator [Thaumarchaeota archaeon]|nr:response regulator [Nitrososphaerota archaeon]MDE1840694.1 response regulator [Nitrososphaerota archaeon]
MGLRILAADDNEFAGLQYKKIFEKHQHDITIAKDGEACVEIYKKKLDENRSDADPFNVVLLDFVMPKKNGVRVAKEILELRPHQKIIFVSAFGNGILDDASIFLKDDVEIIQKPFSLEFLVNKIENSHALRNMR